MVNPAEAVKQGDTYPFLLPVPPLGDLPHSLALGTLGMPGYVVQYSFNLVETSTKFIIKFIIILWLCNFSDGLVNNDVK